MIDIYERKYVAISIKHSKCGSEKSPNEPKDGLYILWGTKRTNDTEQRCFSGYTSFFEACELYSLADFQ